MRLGYYVLGALGNKNSNGRLVVNCRGFNEIVFISLPFEWWFCSNSFMRVHMAHMLDDHIIIGRIEGKTFKS